MTCQCFLPLTPTCISMLMPVGYPSCCLVVLNVSRGNQDTLQLNLIRFDMEPYTNYISHTQNHYTESFTLSYITHLHDASLSIITMIHCTCTTEFSIHLIIAFILSDTTKRRLIVLDQLLANKTAILKPQSIIIK